VSGAFGLLNAYLIKKKKTNQNTLIIWSIVKKLNQNKTPWPYVSNFNALWQVYWLIDLKLKSAVDKSVKCFIEKLKKRKSSVA